MFQPFAELKMKNSAKGRKSRRLVGKVKVETSLTMVFNAAINQLIDWCEPIKIDHKNYIKIIFIRS